MDSTQKLRDMSLADINSLLEKNQHELFKARCDKSISQQTDTSVLPKLKRNIARIKTLLKEQELKDAQDSKK